MAHATLAELRAYVGIPVADTADDVNLTLALDAATSQVDRYCDRVFTQDGAVVARAYMVTDATYLEVDPITTTVGLVVKTDDNADGTYETTWVLGTDYRLEPINAVAEGRPFTRLVGLGTRWFPRNTYRPGVEVTAKSGWGATIPPAVKQATLIQAMHLFKRKDAPFGVAGSAEFGSELRVLNELDRDAQQLVDRYRRQWWVL